VDKRSTQRTRLEWQHLDFFNRTTAEIAVTSGT